MGKMTKLDFADEYERLLADGEKVEKEMEETALGERRVRNILNWPDNEELPPSYVHMARQMTRVIRGEKLTASRGATPNKFVIAVNPGERRPYVRRGNH